MSDKGDENAKTKPLLAGSINRKKPFKCWLVS